VLLPKLSEALAPLALLGRKPSLIMVAPNLKQVEPLFPAEIGKAPAKCFRKKILYLDCAASAFNLRTRVE
jgi:hypothetical protein